MATATVAAKKWKAPWTKVLDAMFGEEKDGDEVELKRIGFRADLPQHLASQHADILRLWNKAADLIFNEDWKGVAAVLGDFRHKFKGHSLLEKMRLYSYLEIELNHVPKTQVVRTLFEKEGTSLEASIAEFVSMCDSIPETEEEIADRIDKYALLSDRLTKRFAREENELFLHYRPSKR